MLAMNRRDRVALHATLNQTVDAFFVAWAVSHRREEYHPTDVTPETRQSTADAVELLRQYADRASERRQTITPSVAAVIADIAATLRHAAHQIEWAATDARHAHDWKLTSEYLQREWDKVDGARALLRQLHPVN